MIRCTRCGRRMKHATASGYGPRCELAVIGPRTRKQAKKRHPRSQRVRIDDNQAELFNEEVSE